MKSKLETLTHLAIIVLCTIVSAVLIQRHFLTPTRSEAGVAQGQKMNLPASVGLGEVERTLVLALSPRCRFCTESLPFYRELIRRRDAERADLRIVAIVGDEVALAEEQRILASSEVRLDAVAPADFASLGIPGTPMMLLVDRHGEAIEVWKGKLTPAEARSRSKLVGAPVTADRRAISAVPEGSFGAGVCSRSSSVTPAPVGPGGEATLGRTSS